jgi:uncharacterized membrane protein
MSSHDPYEAPQSVLDVVEPADDGFLREPRALPAGAGMDWLAAGWRSFTLAPGTWLGIVIVFFLCVMVVSMLPLVGLFAHLLTTLLMGGIMLGCDAQHRGEALDISHLFAGFSRNAGGLLAVGALYLAGALAVGIVIVALMFAMFGGVGLLFGQSDNAAAGALVGSVLVLVGVALVLSIPLMMAFFYAPALVAIHGLGPVDAMGLSFRACLRNFVPLLLFFIVAVLLSIVAMLPLFLGLFVLYPVLLAANYAAYRDTFFAA